MDRSKRNINRNLNIAKGRIAAVIYKLGDTAIYRKKIAKIYYLPLLKELIVISGCTLSEARDLWIK